MLKDPVVLLQNLVLSLSDALDLVNLVAVDHQLRVAYIALRLTLPAARSSEDQTDLLYAAALTENRPYRNGVGRKETIGILRDFASNGSLDPRIVSVLIDEFDPILRERTEAEEAFTEEFARRAEGGRSDGFGPA